MFLKQCRFFIILLGDLERRLPYENHMDPRKFQKPEHLNNINPKNPIKNDEKLRQEFLRAFRNIHWY